jgi:hypothetical protein
MEYSRISLRYSYRAYNRKPADTGVTTGFLKISFRKLKLCVARETRKGDNIPDVGHACNK